MRTYNPNVRFSKFIYNKKIWEKFEGFFTKLEHFPFPAHSSPLSITHSFGRCPSISHLIYWQLTFALYKAFLSPSVTPNQANHIVLANWLPVNSVSSIQSMRLKSIHELQTLLDQFIGKTSIGRYQTTIVQS